MGRKRTISTQLGLPSRWAHKHNAFYYRPRTDELTLFDNKTWYRLGTTYPEALRAFADHKDIETGSDLASVIDRYMMEALPIMKPATQDNYKISLNRLRSAIGQNKIALITPKFVYQYMEETARLRTKNTANADLKVLKSVLTKAVRWGLIDRHPIKSEVSPYGKRDGVNNTRDRYVEDWELDEWKKVAKPLQLAFAALVMLTGARKNEILRIERSKLNDEQMVVPGSKGHKDNIFSMTPALQQATEYAVSTQNQSGDYLLINKKGECYLDSNGYCRTFDKAWYTSIRLAIDQTNLKEPFTCHDLRAKVASDANCDGRAQELLGHNNASMTRKHYRRKIQVIQPTL